MNVYESDPDSLNVNYHDNHDSDDIEVWSSWWDDDETSPVTMTDMTGIFTAYLSPYAGELDLSSGKKTVRPSALASQDLA